MDSLIVLEFRPIFFQFTYMCEMNQSPFLLINKGLLPIHMHTWNESHPNRQITLDYTSNSHTCVKWIIIMSCIIRTRYFQSTYMHEMNQANHRTVRNNLAFQSTYMREMNPLKEIEMAIHDLPIHIHAWNESANMTNIIPTFYMQLSFQTYIW